MKTIIILLLAITVLSCKKEYSNEESEILKQSVIKLDRQIDSLKNINKTLPDSIIDIEQKKAIDNIYFGASEKITKTNIKIFVKKCEIKKERPFPDYYLGNYQFNEFRVDGYYNQDKLYKLTIKGHPISYEKYETKLKSQIEDLNNVINSKFGKSTNSFPLPESFEMNDEFTYLLYQWKIGEKTIEIRLEPNKTFYYVNLEIYQPKIEDQLINEKKNKNKDINSKSGKIL